MKPVQLAYLGCLLALLLPVSVWIPYLQAQQQFASKSRPETTATIVGTSQFWALVCCKDGWEQRLPSPPLPLNLTVTGIYPQAVISFEELQHTLVTLAVRVSVGPDILRVNTSYLGIDLSVKSVCRTFLTNNDPNVSGYGGYNRSSPLASLDYRQGYTASRELSGHANLSLAQDCEDPFPTNAIQPFEFFDQIMLTPQVRISGSLSPINASRTMFPNASDYEYTTIFNLTENPLAVYRFNQPTVVWIAYSFSFLAFLTVGLYQGNNYATKKSIPRLLRFVGSLSAVIALSINQFGVETKWALSSLASNLPLIFILLFGAFMLWILLVQEYRYRRYNQPHSRPF